MRKRIIISGLFAIKSMMHIETFTATERQLFLSRSITFFHALMSIKVECHYLNTFTIINK